jgi:hypothetical protein
VKLDSLVFLQKKHSNHDKYVVIAVEWQDVHQEVVNDCYPDMVWVPSQDKSHEKRCLLDPDTDGRVPLVPPIGPTYTTTKKPTYASPIPRKPTYHKPTTGPGYGVPLAPVYTG